MLRRATQQDADELAAILRSSMRRAMPWLPELHTPDEDRRFLHDVVLPEKEVGVAESGGQIIGFTALGTRVDLEFMEHLYVAPDHQRNGVGNELMNQAKARRPQGFQLWVFQGNQGARRFYEKH